MINLTIPMNDAQLRPKITVVGVGGAGGNAVNNMIRSNLEGVEFVVANTDAQALAGNTAERKLQLGVGITQGLGAGSRPDIGRAAAEEAIEEISAYLDGSHMVFITAGMGGGTGTGAGPVIARAAREMGMLTVGVVTKPFHFEGAHRMRLAEEGLKELQQYVDTLIIIPNQNLFRVANEKTTFADAFKMADEVLDSGVRGVTDLMVMPGLINLDFADIRTVMAEMGKAMMGTGEGDGERRSITSAEAAISNPLLDDVSMKGARGVLINITGGMDMTLYEVDEAVNRIRDEVDPEANIIFGSTFDEKLEGKIRVSVVATGIEADAQASPRPNVTSLNLVSERRPMTAGEPAASDRPATAPAASFPQSIGRAASAAAPAMVAAEAEPAPTPKPVAATVQAQPAAQLAVEAELEPAAEPSLIDFAEAAEDEPAAAEYEQEVQPEPEPVTEEPAEAPAEVARQAAPRAPRRPAPQAPARAEMPAAEPVPAPAPEPAAEQERPEPPRRRPGGLFRRVTGLIKDDAQGAPPAAQHEQAPPAPRPALRPAAPPVERAPVERAQLQQQPVEPVQEPAPRPSTPRAQPAQQRLTGVDASTRPPLPPNEDDGLDIPAFLRRQAN
ncbi:MAG: cell division protein FtsZ [Pseudomonadota bacterium]